PSLITYGTADFAVSTRPADPDIAFESLYRDPFVLIANADDDSICAKRPLDALLTRPLVASGPSSSIRPIVEALLGAGQAVAPPRYEASNISVLGAMVQAGLGVALVPTMALRLMDRSGLSVYPLPEPAVCREIGLLTRKGRTLSSASIHFMGGLREDAQAYGA